MNDFNEGQSGEERAARGSEIRKKVGERIRSWVQEKSKAVPQTERHAFHAVQKKALEGQTSPSLASKIRASIEAGGGVIKDEAKAAKIKMRMKVVGIIATIGAFIDPEPISKAALAATATGIGVAEKATELKAMKDARDIQKGSGLARSADAHGKITEQILQMGNPSY